MKKRFSCVISLILAVVMTTSLLCVQAGAANTETITDRQLKVTISNFDRKETVTIKMEEQVGIDPLTGPIMEVKERTITIYYLPKTGARIQIHPREGAMGADFIYKAYDGVYRHDGGDSFGWSETGGYELNAEYQEGWDITWLWCLICNSAEEGEVFYAYSPVTPAESGRPTANSFTDVPDNAYYAAAVTWAIENGITSGTSATTFSPHDTCTTAQILTFLWRAVGSPEPSIANPFSNVSGTAYYGNAAVWAYEKGLVSGTAFSGSTPCTRAAAVTYLWKLAGSPTAAASSFTDVAADADYAQAVTWAMNNGITAGAGINTFAPNRTCTRAQIMTFLYRDRSLRKGGTDQDGTKATVSQLALRTSLDWSGARSFGADDWYAAHPKTGYAMGYYTIDNGDGTISGLVVPPRDSELDMATGQVLFYPPTEFYVETYNDAGNVTASKTLPMELPIFGAFLSGKNYNYVAFGQENDHNTDSQEVWRIVQYDKAWNRVAAVSAAGGETYTAEPFCSTVSRMAESPDGKSLILHAARQRYDGHQSNITFVMDTQPFRISKLMGEEFPDNHVSHSFGQFVQYDGSRAVTVDHGDGYPRSFVLQTLDRSIRVDLLKFRGESGNNATNAIGSGFEVSDNGYLFLGCSYPQDGSSGAWKSFLACTNKQGGDVSVSWLSDSEYSIKRARLIKLDGDTFVAIYSTDIGNYFYYQVLNGSGEKVGDEGLVAGVPMPPTQPIVQGGAIQWIQADENGAAHLYTLTIS